MGLVSFVDRGSEADDEKLRGHGVDIFSSEAVPYYARWTRQDVVAVTYLLNRICLLLVIIAIPLWIMALR